MVGAILGWGLSHQIGSETIFDDCSAAGGGAFVLLVCAPALVLTAVGGVCSLSAWASDGAEGGTRRFVALVSMMLAGLAAFAIILQIAAGLILPVCAA
jgi:hypothetical protein